MRRIRGAKNEVAGVFIAPDKEGAIESAIGNIKITDPESNAGWWDGRSTDHQDEATGKELSSKASRSSHHLTRRFLWLMVVAVAQWAS